jgi:hypothetical protein
MLCVQEAIMKTIRILLVLILGLTMSFAALAGGKRGGGHHGGKHHHGARWSWRERDFSATGRLRAAGRGMGRRISVIRTLGVTRAGGQEQPTTYIEQPAPQAQQQAPTGYWYYCADPGAYYPYIKECPAGWQRVAPQPSN